MPSMVLKDSLGTSGQVIKLGRTAHEDKGDKKCKVKERYLGTEHPGTMNGMVGKKVSNSKIVVRDWELKIYEPT